MALGLSPNQVNNMVNSIYEANGKNPYATDKRDGLKVTKGVERRFGDTYVASPGLKAALNDPSNHLAISLRDQYHPGTAAQLSRIVTNGLDRADGRGDGWVKLEDRGAFADVLRDYTGIKREGYISTDALNWGLQQGSIVVGEGGQLLSRSEAQAHGDTIVAVHEDKAGPTVALD
jgi:hypothetical protein